MNARAVPHARRSPIAWVRRRAEVWSIAGALALACTPNPDPESLFDRYLDAVNRHDIETLFALTAPDAAWGTMTGRDALIQRHAFDAALNIHLVATDIVARGDTVEATLVERTDAHRAHGPDSTVHYARFVFRDGLVVSKGRTRPDPQTDDFRARAGAFRRWAQRAHPELIPVLTSAPGVGIVNGETGALTSELLAEWVSLGRPGAAIESGSSRP